MASWLDSGLRLQSAALLQQLQGVHVAGVASPLARKHPCPNQHCVLVLGVHLDRAASEQALLLAVEARQLLAGHILGDTVSDLGHAAFVSRRVGFGNSRKHFRLLP